MEGDPIQEIAFGSCLKDELEAPTLSAIAELKPDVFVWLGDVIYGDSEDMAVLCAKYQLLAQRPAYLEIKKTTQVIGTWDDHDYGENNAGTEFSAKSDSQQEFLNFLEEPIESARRTQLGIYDFEDFGVAGQSVRIILLDTRYHRQAPGPNGTILGAAQWDWLEKALVNSSAMIHLIASSIQVIPTEHRFEKWANFPSERKKLLSLLARPDVPPVILLSGDRHLGEISVDTESLSYPLYEITSSSLNLPLGGKSDEANRWRIGPNFRPANFGTLSIDWSRSKPVVTASIRDQKGRPQRAVTFEIQR